MHAICIAPVNIAELFVEALNDVGQRVHLGLRLTTTARLRRGRDLGICIGQLNTLHGLPFYTIAVHIDGLEHTSREVLLDWGRQLGNKEVEEDRELLPAGVRVRENCTEKAVGPRERL